jgi:hypothetical protein
MLKTRLSLQAPHGLIRPSSTVLGTTDALVYQRWVSSIDRKQLTTKFEVREGHEYAGDEKLETLLKHLHDRQAQESPPSDEST